MRKAKMRGLTLVVAGLTALGWTGTALAHPHKALPAHQGDGQVIANGQLHAVPSGLAFCGGDPAAYGLETAHHGPDAGVAGKADGSCYQLDSWPPTSDVNNPALG